MPTLHSLSHQQAMVIAKQTYPMTVSQQVMTAANDDWERGSSIAGLTCGGGGSPPSIYGGTVYGINMSTPTANMGMGMGATMPSIFPASPASMYVGDGASVVDSTTGGVGWGSASVYGAAFTGTGRVGRMDSLTIEHWWAEPPTYSYVSIRNRWHESCSS